MPGARWAAEERSLQLCIRQVEKVGSTSSLATLQLAQHLDGRTKQRPGYLHPAPRTLVHLALITARAYNPGSTSYSPSLC